MSCPSLAALDIPCQHPRFTGQNPFFPCPGWKHWATVSQQSSRYLRHSYIFSHYIFAYWCGLCKLRMRCLCCKRWTGEPAYSTAALSLPKPRQDFIWWDMQGQHFLKSPFSTTAPQDAGPQHLMAEDVNPMKFSYRSRVTSLDAGMNSTRVWKRLLLLVQLN